MGLEDLANELEYARHFDDGSKPDDLYYLWTGLEQNCVGLEFIPILTLTTQRMYDWITAHGNLESDKRQVEYLGFNTVELASSLSQCMVTENSFRGEWFHKNMLDNLSREEYRKLEELPIFLRILLGEKVYAQYENARLAYNSHLPTNTSTIVATVPKHVIILTPA